jgi:hypothetical protein
MTTMRGVLWATKEFGRAQLGDERRRRRLLEIAATIATNPAGQITALFVEGAAREAAYRFVENEAICSDEMARAAHRATANWCFGQQFVFVPVDGTSLSLHDRAQRRGLGVINKTVGAHGLEVMTAIAVLRDGTPAGICGQRYWARTEPVGLGKDDYDRRGIEQKETRYWLEVMHQTRTALTTEAPGTRPWFQLDRGGDAWPILLDAVDRDAWLTVRAAQNRRLTATIHGKRQYLWNWLSRCEPQGSYLFPIAAGPDRQMRVATVQIQFCSVVLDLKDRRKAPRIPILVWAVRVVETDRPGAGQEPIEWLLLTTFPVQTLADALLVVDGYSSRWRIEDFHKTWKTGVCRIEDTQLHARAHIERFAVISASVAMRIQRLTHLARNSPDEPATVELSRAEIDATILLRKPKGIRRGATPTISQVVRWIADIGGFMGPSPQNISALRRPGAIVIGRGLRRIEPVAALLSEGVEM